MPEDGRQSLPHETPLWVDTSDAVFFLTICLKDRTTKALTQGDTPARLLDAIRFYQEKGRWWIHIAVIMPDHIHILASFPENMPGTVREWKRWTSTQTGITWLRDFFDHRLRNDESLREKADYIFLNPVRAGLVETPEDWPYTLITKD